ncbi:MAG: aminopeptidase P N-terminal domain-containing protein [Longimicrobiales bacterium]
MTDAGDRSPLSAAPHASRLRAVQQRLDNAALVLAAAPEVRIGADTELRYVVDSELYYLTGYTEPDAVLVVTATAITLFVRPRDEKSELWSGVRGGVEAAQRRYHADAAFPVVELTQQLPLLLGDVDTIHARLRGGRADVDAALEDVLAAGRRNRPRTGRAPFRIADPGVLLDELRLRKDESEIARIRRAAEISIATFREAASLIRTGIGEWQIEAALQSGFRSRRASGEAFPSIVGSGVNGTVLHYVTNNDELREGDFVLIDAGARYEMYCADITRTYAVGRVSPERMALHDIVRSAHAAAVAMSRAGSTIDAIDAAAKRVLVQGMIDLDLVDGPLDNALAGDAYKRYYPHRTSHWLGLDVHDVGVYVADCSARPLEVGMVFTIEPGLYIPADDERARPALRGTGIRLEDDVLITAHGADVLTAALPLDADPTVALSW